MGYHGVEVLPVHSELRIPADPRYIVVAKRAAAGFASVAGLDIESIDDVVIAVSQACEHAITCLCRTVGSGTGQLRLDFVIEGRRLDINVRSVCSHAEVEAARRRDLLEAASQRVVEVASSSRVPGEEEALAGDLALQLMGLFVDDFGYRVDDRTGALRVRLTKFRVS